MKQQGRKDDEQSYDYLTTSAGDRGNSRIHPIPRPSQTSTRLRTRAQNEARESTAGEGGGGDSRAESKGNINATATANTGVDDPRLVPPQRSLSISPHPNSVTGLQHHTTNIWLPGAVLQQVDRRQDDGEDGRGHVPQEGGEEKKLQIRNSLLELHAKVEEEGERGGGGHGRDWKAQENRDTFAKYTLNTLLCDGGLDNASTRSLLRRCIVSLGREGFLTEGWSKHLSWPRGDRIDYQRRPRMFIFNGKACERILRSRKSKREMLKAAGLLSLHEKLRRAEMHTFDSKKPIPKDTVKLIRNTGITRQETVLVNMEQIKLQKRGIWRAIRDGDFSKVKKLLSSGFKFLCRGPFGETILHTALLHQRTKIAFYIIDKFPCLVHSIYKTPLYMGETAMHMAIVNENVEILRCLLEKKMTPNGQKAKGRFFQPDYENGVYFGESPLHFATCMGHMEILKLLIDHGADISLADSYGNTAFHFAAAQHNNAEILKLLYEWGVVRYGEPETKKIVCSPNNIGLAPIQLATLCGRAKAVEYILSAYEIVGWKWGKVMRYSALPVDLVLGKQGIARIAAALEHSEILLLPILKDIMTEWWSTMRVHFCLSGLGALTYVLLLTALVIQMDASIPLYKASSWWLIVWTIILTLNVGSIVHKTIQLSYEVKEKHLLIRDVRALATSYHTIFERIGIAHHYFAISGTSMNLIGAPAWLIVLNYNLSLLMIYVFLLKFLLIYDGWTTMIFSIINILRVENGSEVYAFMGLFAIFIIPIAVSLTKWLNVLG